MFIQPRTWLRFVMVWLVMLLAAAPAAHAQVNAETVTLMGRNALSVDDYLTAIRYFNQAIDAKPYLPRPYYYRAYAKFTLEDYQGAEDDCTKSLSLNPYITEVYALRGLCRIHNNRFDEAAADYTRVLAETPEDQGARYNRALCRLQLKDYARCDSDLNVLLQRWPNFYRAYMVKAQVALEQTDTVQGLAWIDSLLVRMPTDAQAWAFKGQYALQQENYSLADSCLTQALAARPGDHELYVLRAQALHALGQFGRAIADYDRAITLVPEHFVAHYNRGLLRSFTGDLNRAIDDFDFVLSKEPDNTLALYNRAQLRAATGNYRGAIADYSVLIRQYPQFTYGYLARAECRRKVGDVRGALSDESVVARRELDLAFARKPQSKAKKVRKRSEHALEQYQQLVQEDADTVRNVFGTLYGKVQNEKASPDLLPMYSLAFRTDQTRGYHATAFVPETGAITQTLELTSRKFCLTAEVEANAAEAAAHDEDMLAGREQRLSRRDQCLVRSAIAAARYDYDAALNEAGYAVHTDTASAVAYMQRAAILMLILQSAALSATDIKARLALARADLQNALRLQPAQAIAYYNLACLEAWGQNAEYALQCLTHAITLDARLPEAYYNRALLYLRQGDKEKAAADFSAAGQLGLYKAYAQLKAMKQ